MIRATEVEAMAKSKAKPDALVWCYVTAKDSRQGWRLAEAIVGERLAACANVLGRIQSVYRWQGKIEIAREVGLVFKTRQSLVARLSARVKELHTYDCPCVVALPIVGGHPPYLEWLADETAARV